MTRLECVKLYMSLENCKNLKDKEGKPLKLKKNLVKAIIYNKKTLSSEYDILLEIGKPLAEKETILNDKRNTIIKKYCILDEKDNMLTDSIGMVQFDSAEKSMLCLKDIEETLKTEIDEVNKLRVEYKESENEEVDITIEDLTRIEDDDIPEEASFEVLEQLYKLV